MLPPLLHILYVASTIVVPLVKSSLLGWTPLAGKNESIPHLTTFTQWRDILEEESNQFILQPGSLSHLNQILKGLFTFLGKYGRYLSEIIHD